MFMDGLWPSAARQRANWTRHSLCYNISDTTLSTHLYQKFVSMYLRCCKVYGQRTGRRIHCRNIFHVFCEYSGKPAVG